LKQEYNMIEEYASDFDEEAIIKYFSSLPFTVILDSSMQSKDLGQYTIIGFDPFLFFTTKGNRIILTSNGVRKELCGNPLEVLRGLLEQYKTCKLDIDIPFCGGCMGYISYDLVHFIEKIRQKSCDDLKMDDIAIGFYNKTIVFDHNSHKLFIVSTSIGTVGEHKEAAYKNAQDIKRTLEKIMRYQIVEKTIKNNSCSSQKLNNICSNFDKRSYMDMVNKAHEYIRNGDIYQVNLSQRFEVCIHTEPCEIYLKLRKCSPAPFSAYLNFDNVKVISSSPERFLKISGSNIETRPIKGTRPRGKDLESDATMKNELIESQKERAELTMIVDLERNDLGKVCEFGSVVVQKHFEIEAYANVFHAVSTVLGKLKEGVDFIDCLYAAFPGGSITGAPKIRAMEIIEELEPVKRGIYTGAIGYIGFDGTVDLNVAIRTIVVKGDKAYYNVGGGIVWDSEPEKEFEETLYKGIKMMEVLTEINEYE
jgi:para-aminobenzoate synthetase component 1